MNHTRPTSTTIAAILLALLSAQGLISTLIPAFAGGVPAIVLYGSLVLGVAGFVAAYGLWNLKRWGAYLTAVVTVLGALSAAPGIAFAPTTLLFVLAVLGVAGSALVLILAILPASWRAYA